MVFSALIQGDLRSKTEKGTFVEQKCGGRRGDDCDVNGKFGDRRGDYY